MLYYFIKHATTNYGPINFPLAIPIGPGMRIADNVDAEAGRRGIIICHDWAAEPIDAYEYKRLVS